MDLIKQFFSALFAGLDPLAAANWVRALVGVVWAGFITGATDVLVQILGILNSGGPFVIDKMLVLRTVAIGVLPFLIGFLRKSPGEAKEDNQ